MSTTTSWQRARAARASVNMDEPGFAIVVFRPGHRAKVQRMTYAEAADALTAALDYLKAGYQVRLSDDTVEHFGQHVTRAAWWPSLRDWKLLLGMLRRAAELPGFFSPAAQAAGRGEAERLAVQLGELVARIGAQS